MGPGASERSSCVYPSSARFDPFWGRIPASNSALLPTLEKPLNARYFKEVDGVYQTPAARGLYPAHPLSSGWGVSSRPRCRYRTPQMGER